VLLLTSSSSLRMRSKMNETDNCRVEHRRSKFRSRTFRFQPFRTLVPKSLKPCSCLLCPL
jgi:hypothetical protein